MHYLYEVMPCALRATGHVIEVCTHSPVHVAPHVLRFSSVPLLDIYDYHTQQSFLVQTVPWGGIIAFVIVFPNSPYGPLEILIRSYNGALK